MNVKKLLILCLFFALAGGARAQSDLKVNASGSPYVALALSTQWNQLSRVYFFTPLNSNTGICTFLVNNNPSNSHTFTLAVFQTGDPQAANYSQHTGRWIQVPTQPTFTSASINPSASLSGFSQTSAAAQVAIQISGTSSAGGSPDTADLYVVQTNASGCGSATGGLPAIAAYGQVNYGTLAGSFLPIQLDNNLAGGNDTGLHIGSGFVSSAQQSGNAWAADNVGGGKGAFITAPVTISNGTWHGLQSGFYSPNGTVMVSQAGWVNNITGNVSTGTDQTLSIFNEQQTGSPASGMPNACYFTLHTTALTGTSPTFDLYIQTANDASNGQTIIWNDIIHFAQVTTGTNLNQIAAIHPNSITPIAVKNETLAAATVVDGQIGPQLQAIGHVTGTSGNAQYQLTVDCQ